jgi:aryl-alcohol dehydrogenase-like predicted oxidoreductase
MHHVQFGRSGLYVSRLSYGTWRLEKTTDDQVELLINEVIDSGINLLETCLAQGQARPRLF